MATVNIGRIPAKHAYYAPGADVLVDSTTGRRATFGQMDDRVRRLANGLRDLGLGIGDRVAILSKNSIEFQEVLFAAGRAGLIAQPLNWRLATAELARILVEGEPKAIVCSDEFATEAKELQSLVDVPAWLLVGDASDGSYEELLARSSAEEPEGSDRIGGDDPYLILYTGGTTGESKGVLHTHRSVYTGMITQNAQERVVPTDVYLLTGQMFHIPVVLALNYMAHGRPVVLMNFEPELALRLIEAERISGFLGVTTMLNWMMAVPGFERYDLSSLRIVGYGGGPMPTAVVRQALDAFPADLFQGYGQTEGVTMTFLGPEDHRAAVAGRHVERLRSCGREGFATTLRVVDADGRPAPRDGKRTGEIVVRSEANMAGYWRRPDLTAETMRGGWMHTGDIATWDEDGYVFIVDRAKDMIISGGENIYSAQVEEAIAQHPAVLECAVVGVPDEEWGESVKAFVVLKPDHRATEREIIDEARRHLASYQKPRSVEFLPSLPKAPTGKVLKRELRAPFWEGRERQV